MDYLEIKEKYNWTSQQNITSSIICSSILKELLSELISLWLAGDLVILGCFLVFTQASYQRNTHKTNKHIIYYCFIILTLTNLLLLFFFYTPKSMTFKQCRQNVQILFVASILIKMYCKFFTVTVKHFRLNKPANADDFCCSLICFHIDFTSLTVEIY